MADLLEIVDMSVPEADGVEPYVKVSEDGQHYVELLEADAPCEVCEHGETQLVDADDAVIVREPPTYQIKGGRGPALCRHHLKREPYVLSLVEVVE